MSRRKSIRGLLPLPVLLLLALLVLNACGGATETRDRPDGSVLWLTPEALPRIGAEARETLLGAGVRELFVEAGRMVDEDDGPGTGRVEDLLATLPRTDLRLPVTLVVHGAWDAGTDPEMDSDLAGEELAGELAALRRGAEAKGLTPVGYHLDIEAATGAAELESLAGSLQALRGAMADGGDDTWLSLTAVPASLAAEEFAAVSENVDFLVPFLYGARQEGRPGPDPERAWDPAIAEAALPRLQELGKEYLLGVGTGGLLQRLDEAGNVIGSTRRAALKPLLALPELEIGFGGLDTDMRQRLVFQANAPLRLGEWSLAPGDQVQVVRPAVSHLWAVARRADEATPQLHRGQAYVRLPVAGEDLSLGLASIAAAAGAEEPMLDLDLEVSPVGQNRSRLRFRLANPGPLSSDVAHLESNYLEVRVAGGGTIASADAGGFQRYQLEHDGSQVRDMRSLRRADTVRFYLPLIEPGDEVESGPLVLRGVPRDGPVVRVGGRFSVPGGGELVLPEQVWPAPPEVAPTGTGSAGPEAAGQAAADQELVEEPAAASTGARS